MNLHPKPARRHLTAGARPAERPNARKDLVRDELISRAAEVFNTRGYLQTNIADIAQVLGLKRSSLYHYFANKDELMQAIVAHEIAEREAFGAPIVAASHEPATPRLRRMLGHRVEREFTRGISLRTFDQLDQDVAESVVTSVRGAHEKGLEMYIELLRQGIASEEFRAEEPRLLALAVISLTNWSPWWLTGAAAIPVDRIAVFLSDLAIAAVRADDAAATAPDLGPAIAIASDLVTTLRNLQS
jgi:AcrR family transcriptional regulator